MNLDAMLKEVSAAQASDLYLVAGAVPCMNQEGVYRAVQAAGGARLSPGLAEDFAHHVMTAKQWEEFEQTREMNLAYMSDEAGRFRINVFVQRGSVAMVCRRVVMDIPTLRSLGLPPVLRDIALADRGIVLVTGSTGSGKSTSLASMIDYRNHIRSGHIITIEDPVEFVYRHRRSIVTQREVGIDTDSFHSALRNTLRQAPQVICIGEVRDAETVQFAMHASETGHLVFATLHSTSAALAIERVLHFYPGEMKEQIQMQLSLNLKAIICQRLVPREDGGRVAAVEILLDTPRMVDLIAKGDMAALKQALAAENQDGIVNFDKSLFRLYKRGLITPEDALQSAESANDLKLKMSGIGIAPGSSWEDISNPWDKIESDYDPPAHLPHLGGKRDSSATGGYTNEGAAAFPRAGQSMHLVNPIGPGGRSPEPPRAGEAAPPAAEAPKPIRPVRGPVAARTPSDTGTRRYRFVNTPLPSDVKQEKDDPPQQE